MQPITLNKSQQETQTKTVFVCGKNYLIAPHTDEQMQYLLKPPMFLTVWEYWHYYISYALINAGMDADDISLSHLDEEGMHYLIRQIAILCYANVQRLQSMNAEITLSEPVSRGVN